MLVIQLLGGAIAIDDGGQITHDGIIAIAQRLSSWSGNLAQTIIAIVVAIRAVAQIGCRLESPHLIVGKGAIVVANINGLSRIVFGFLKVAGIEVARFG